MLRNLWWLHKSDHLQSQWIWNQIADGEAENDKYKSRQSMYTVKTDNKTNLKHKTSSHNAMPPVTPSFHSIYAKKVGIKCYTIRRHYIPCGK